MNHRPTKDSSARSELELSVIVATRGAEARVAKLLARLDQQTLAARRFELLLVDHGAHGTLSVDRSAHRYALNLLHLPGAGPAAARNLALDHASGSIVLFLEDDALPAFDLLERHLAVHALRTDRVAVLGTFAFSAEAKSRPFVQVLDDSDLFLDFVRLRDAALHPWTYFWTCNLSLPLEAVREAGGFDADGFPEGVLDDVELGLRLAERGFSVLYRADLGCEHDHAFTADEFFERAVRMGLYSARLEKLYARSPVYLRELGADRRGTPRRTDDAIERAVSLVEGYDAKAREFLDKLRLLEIGGDAGRLDRGLLSELRSMTRRLALAPFSRGELIELAGFDPENVLLRGPTRGRTTSVILATRDRRDSLEQCLAGLRATREPAHPLEILVVDEGSSDATAEFLARQSDVVHLTCPPGSGAARARNLALSRARGQHVVFLSDDVRLTPGWLSRLLYHAEIDPLSGCVAPTSHRARRVQRLEFDGGADPESRANFARRVSREAHRRHEPAPLLDGFCLLASRRVLDAIGGFDERLAADGSTEDFTLRATLAGFQNRCARDVFVGRETDESVSLAERGRDAELLANKWGLAPLRSGARDPGAPADDTRSSALPGYESDERRLATLLARTWSTSELFIPIRSAESQPGALPRPAEQGEPSGQDRSTRRT